MRKKALILLALFVGLVGGSAVAWAVNPDWQQVGTPSGAPGRNAFFGVSFSTANNGHAVGYYIDSTSGLYRTFAARWNGTSWQTTTTPNPGNGNNYLYDVETLSATDAWAVGRTDSASGSPLILRYDSANNTWQQYVVQISGVTQSALFGVAAVSSNDIYAVGYYYENGIGPAKTLTLHWDGSSWTVPGLSSMALGSGDSKLFDITVVKTAPIRLWTVGAYQDNGTTKPVVLRDNLENESPFFWNVIPSANLSGDYCLRGVTATDASNAWAVGYSGSACLTEENLTTSPAGQNTVALIERWDALANKWVRVAEPTFGRTTKLVKVDASDPTKVWAVGFHSQTGTEDGWVNLVMHRHAALPTEQWVRHCPENPESGRPWNQLFAVDALSSNLAWAVGWYYPESHPYVKPTLALRYGQVADCHLDP